MENMNISKDKFRFADPSRRTGDKKFDTKQTTYTKDVFHRFCKNKSSVIAAFIIVILVLFAIIVPMFCETNYSLSLTDTAYLKYAKLLPKCSAFEGTGFWDGTKTVSINENEYNAIKAIEKEIERLEECKKNFPNDEFMYEPDLSQLKQQLKEVEAYV